MLNNLRGLSNHKMVACYTMPKYQELYGQSKNYPQNVEKVFSNEIRQEGIYMFGGKDEFGNVHSQLYHFNTNMRPWKMTEPEVLGKKPTGRYGHCMVYMKEKNYILIYGGRNNDLYESKGKTVVDDIFLLRLNYMVWCEVDCYMHQVEGRYLFSSAPCDSKIFIIGGMNDESYIGGKAITLETDENISLEMYQQLSKRKNLNECNKMIRQMTNKTHKVKLTEKSVLFDTKEMLQQVRKEMAGASLYPSEYYTDKMVVGMNENDFGKTMSQMGDFGDGSNQNLARGMSISDMAQSKILNQLPRHRGTINEDKSFTRIMNSQLKELKRNK